MENELCRLCSLPSRHIKIWESWREASNQCIKQLDGAFFIPIVKSLLSSLSGLNCVKHSSVRFMLFPATFFSNYCLCPFKWKARRKALIFQEDSVNRKPHLHGLIGSLSGICWFMHYMPKRLWERNWLRGGGKAVHIFQEKHLQWGKMARKREVWRAYILRCLWQAERWQRNDVTFLLPSGFVLIGTRCWWDSPA